MLHAKERIHRVRKNRRKNYNSPIFINKNFERQKSLKMRTLSKKFDTIEAVTTHEIKDRKPKQKDPLSMLFKTNHDIESSVKNNNSKLSKLLQRFDLD